MWTNLSIICYKIQMSFKKKLSLNLVAFRLRDFHRLVIERERERESACACLRDGRGREERRGEEGRKN